MGVKKKSYIFKGFVSHKLRFLKYELSREWNLKVCGENSCRIKEPVFQFWA